MDVIGHESYRIERERGIEGGKDQKPTLCSIPLAAIETSKEWFSLTDPVKVRHKGRDITHRSTVRVIERFDTNGCRKELALCWELKVQLSAQLSEQEEVIGRVLRRVNVG